MYSKNYYSRHANGSLNSANRILSLLSEFIHPNSVADIGCGTGTWGFTAEKIWGAQIFAFDRHRYDDCDMYISAEKYFQCDLRQKTRLGRYDLAICVEVIEHIDQNYEDIVIDNLCACSDTLLFSGALPFQGGTGHINERPFSYWLEKFNMRGYTMIQDIRWSIWDQSDIEIWYRNNIMFLMKTTTKNKPTPYPVDIIHPQMLERILLKRGVL